MKTAVITGVTGQDGAYLAELLLGKGYKVYGAFRRTSSVNFWRLGELGVEQHPNLTLLEYDLTDLSANIRLLQFTRPDEVYNLAAQSFVGVSFEQPVTTAEISTAIAYIDSVHAKLRATGTSNDRLDAEAWASFIRVLFRLNEFTYLD